MKNKFLLPFLLIIFPQFLKAQIIQREPFSIGETIEIESKILNENRSINIYLPNGYHKDSLKQYPVIYLLDGSRDEDFIHISGLVQFCSFSWINIIPETIVVGIANVDRKRDFTYPTNDAEQKEHVPTSGGSEKFIQFIEKEVQPLIGKNYNISSTRTLIGQSLGGLLATEILVKKPELFENYIIISPSLWWDNESLLSLDLKKNLNVKSIYVGVGKEGEVMERVAKELYDKIDAQKFENLNLYFGFFEKQNHGDVLHVAAYDSFLKIFQEKEKKD